MGWRESLQTQTHGLRWCKFPHHNNIFFRAYDRIIRIAWSCFKTEIVQKLFFAKILSRKLVIFFFFLFFSKGIACPRYHSKDNQRKNLFSFIRQCICHSRSPWKFYTTVTLNLRARVSIYVGYRRMAVSQYRIIVSLKSKTCTL